MDGSEVDFAAGFRYAYVDYPQISFARRAKRLHDGKEIDERNIRIRYGTANETEYLNEKKRISVIQQKSSTKVGMPFCGILFFLHIFLLTCAI